MDMGEFHRISQETQEHLDRVTLALVREISRRCFHNHLPNEPLAIWNALCALVPEWAQVPPEVEANLFATMCFAVETQSQRDDERFERENLIH